MAALRSMGYWKVEDFCVNFDCIVNLLLQKRHHEIEEQNVICFNPLFYHHIDLLRVRTVLHCH